MQRDEAIDTDSSAFRVILNQLFVIILITFSIVLHGTDVFLRLMSRLDDLVRHPQAKHPLRPLLFFLSLRNWFRFNRLRESGNLWFRVENWPPFNCTFLPFPDDAMLRLPLLSTWYDFFSFHAIFSVKIIKRNLSHSFFSSDFKIYDLYGTAFCACIFHISVIRQTQSASEFLNYNFTEKCPFFVFLFRLDCQGTSQITNIEHDAK